MCDHIQGIMHTCHSVSCISFTAQSSLCACSQSISVTHSTLPLIIHHTQGGSYAIGNHELAPDASHPMYLNASNVVDVASDGLFRMTGPDPGWRNEADCGFQVREV